MMFGKLLIPIAIIFSTAGIHAQSPTNNPYADFYKTTGHWSDSLQWSKVTNAFDCKNLIGNDNSVDSATWNNIQQQISESGGGVLYFPPGKYNFNFDAKIFDGVIVRGAEIPQVTLALESDYRPLTQFLFPKYNPIFENSGTPNATAFKRIFASVTGQRNFGIVNVDINRAVINFWGSWPKAAHENVIIFGVRQNNAAMPDVKVPSKVQNDKGKGWQRWPLNDANVTVCVYNTAVIANCRFNDTITDNFVQPGYMTNDGYVFTEGVTFNYVYHTAITIHQKFGSDWRKCEIKDNYILSSRYFDKISAMARKLDIDRNKLVDSPQEKEHTLITKLQYAYPLIEEVKKVFETKTFTSVNHDTIRYQLLKPSKIEPNKKYPLIIFFHGLGENAKNSNRLTHLVSLFNTEFNRDNFPCYVLVPHIKEHDHWYAETLHEQETFSMQMTMQLANQLLKEEPIERGRVYASGIATGGKGALEAVLRYPKTFSAAVLAASYWPFTDDELKKLKGKSVWISAGAVDPHVPVNYYRLMNKRLSDFAVDVNYNEYPNVDVFSWLPLLYDQKFLPWLFSKKG